MVRSHRCPATVGGTKSAKTTEGSSLGKVQRVGLSRKPGNLPDFLADETFEGKVVRLLDWPQSPKVGVFLCLPRQAGPRTMVSTMRREGGMRPQHSCLIHVYASVLWLTVIWGLACLPSHGLAQSSPDAETPLQLAPVQVRGQRLGVEQTVRETSTFATTIDTSEATAKVQSVADVLSESVGVQVRRFGGLGAFSTVSIRGSTPNQVEVYLDNVLLNTANAGLVDLGSVPLDNVDHIEIYRGFAPLQLGAGSIGGAINLVTRPAAGVTTNSASASYGSFDTRKVTLYRSQGFDRLGYVVLFNYTESLGDFTFLDDNGTPYNTLDDAIVRRQNNDFRSFNGNAKGEAILGGWQLTLSNDIYTKD
jgi:TonB-dependent Receptor Plug Domain